MKKFSMPVIISLVTIIPIGVLLVIFTNSNFTEKPLATQDTEQDTAEVTNEEYVVDSSDFYSVEPASESVISQELTQEEKDWLIHMREEEKLARDVYTTLGEKWQINIFTNIAKSEQTHTDSIKTLLERYDIEDPVKTNEVGEFTLPEMQKLYDDLVAQGSKSLLEALIVCVTIEDLDIYDLDVAIKETSQSDIKTVYENLKKGSRNHMRAFVKQIDKEGGEYIPQFISEEYSDIISKSQERGRVR